MTVDKFIVGQVGIGVGLLAVVRIGNPDFRQNGNFFQRVFILQALEYGDGLFIFFLLVEFASLLIKAHRRGSGHALVLHPTEPRTTGNQHR